MIQRLQRPCSSQTQTASPDLRPGAMMKDGCVYNILHSPPSHFHIHLYSDILNGMVNDPFSSPIIVTLCWTFVAASSSRARPLRSSDDPSFNVFKQTIERPTVRWELHAIFGFKHAYFKLYHFLLDN